MTIEGTSITSIDMHLSEIAGLVQALIFMQEEADEAQRAALHGAMVAMLYVITDKLRQANGNVSVIYRQTAAEGLH